MEKVRVGLVGAGQISFHHAKGWLTHPRVEIVAVCDRDEHAAQRRAKQCGAAKTYTSYDELLSSDDIDAVDITLPHHLHADCAIKAANRAKHILVQKPMAMASEDCDAMIKSARKANVKLMCMENYLFFPPIAKAKQLIVEGKIGRPNMIRIESTLGFGGISKDDFDALSEYASRELPDWFKDTSISGGWIFDDGVHHFNVARWLMSTDWNARKEFDSIFAFVPDLQREKPSVISWTHQNGGLGSLSYGEDIGHTDPQISEIHGRWGSLHEGYHVIGTKGIIWVTHVTARTFGEPSLVLYSAEEGTRTAYEELNDDWSDSLAAGVHHFIDCVLQDKEPRNTGEDGKKCVEAAFAAHESARQGTSVKIGAVHRLPFPGIWDKPMWPLKEPQRH